MDEGLRELERRYRRSGSVDDGVAWLAARLRAGDVTCHDLDVAALCGDRAARALRPTVELLTTGEVARIALGSERSVRDWVGRGCPAVRSKGRAYRFDLRAVLDWLDATRYPAWAGPVTVTLRALARQHPRAAEHAKGLVSGDGAIDALRAAVIGWALEPGLRAPRHEVVVTRWNGDEDAEEELDVRHDVVDRRTGRVVATLHGVEERSLGRARRRRGVVQVEVGPGGVIAHHDDGRVEQVDLEDEPG